MCGRAFFIHSCFILPIFIRLRFASTLFALEWHAFFPFILVFREKKEATHSSNVCRKQCISNCDYGTTRQILWNFIFIRFVYVVIVEFFILDFFFISLAHFHSSARAFGWLYFNKQSTWSKSKCKGKILKKCLKVI